MSVKISQLPLLSTLPTNTSNSYFVVVDSANSTTTRATATSVAAGLYNNNVLRVGQNFTSLPNTIAQFSLGSDSYIQTNLVNNNDGGSADHVLTANSGSDTTLFVDLGIANKNFVPGSEYNSLGTAISPLDGYLYSQGQGTNLSGGNLIIGAINSSSELRFIAGGGSSANVISKVTANGLYLLNGKPLYFADGTFQSTAGSSVANTIYLQSVDNTQNGNIIAIQTQISNINANTSSLNTSIYTLNSYAYGVNAYAYGVNAYSQIAYVGNTTNINLPGTLNVVTSISSNVLNTTSPNQSITISPSGTGNVYITDTTPFVAANSVTVSNPNFSTTSSLMKLVATPNGVTVSPSNSSYMLHVTGKDNIATRVVLDSFGAASNVYPLLAGRAGRGTAASPTATQSGDVLMRIAGQGYGTTGFSGSSPTKIDLVAEENFTDTTKGTRIEFWNTAANTNTLMRIATFNANTVTFTGSVYPQKGFIYSPLPYPGAQTAITIDFANNSLVRANTSAGLTVSLSNFVSGKVVKLWVTNTSGTNQTFTHGCSALNSTVNSTTYAIPSTSTICCEYVSFGTDSANTYVSVIHA